MSNARAGGQSKNLTQFNIQFPTFIYVMKIVLVKLIDRGDTFSVEGRFPCHDFFEKPRSSVTGVGGLQIVPVQLVLLNL